MFLYISISFSLCFHSRFLRQPTSNRNMNTHKRIHHGANLNNCFVSYSSKFDKNPFKSITQGIQYRIVDVSVRQEKCFV